MPATLRSDSFFQRRLARCRDTVRSPPSCRERQASERRTRITGASIAIRFDQEVGSRAAASPRALPMIRISAGLLASQFVQSDLVSVAPLIASDNIPATGGIAPFAGSLTTGASVKSRPDKRLHPHLVRS